MTEDFNVLRNNEKMQSNILYINIATGEGLKKHLYASPRRVTITPARTF